ncbi:solute carrier family 66 (lysosomal lysine-arginine transporter), member 1 [Marchantia polymorpha subsp. ruderalis]|uniref:Uncharacterized protein n=2 Tax=Marchantia polymorpha TaxID=3197 RepID=A0AAF6AXZ0_MARPO|nr:hypothetical protein MARPO_0006s0096 [Marchantia polymorpha]BBN04624.1 hypothetical protein Mp_3g06260 [Marchantia polymorpha subsp. ruderalis]|eukprot:PTQ48060.1 hypothetical protein MARPO_0006s0096 [Marchantia polymorpha]
MFGAFGTGNCECEPNANLFVKEWFSDCVYTTWDLAGFCIGLSSVLFWIVAQLPQFISNIKHQSADALSPWFLFQWLSGDSFNLLGCLLTGDQLATETLTATYFIFSDCLIISQYIFYSIRAKEKLVLTEEEKEAEDVVIKAVTEYQPPTPDDLLEFRKRLAKMTIVIPDSGEYMRHIHDTGGPVQDRNGNHLLANVHQYHPVTYVAGRSGAAMITHAMQSPLSIDQSPRADVVKKFSATPAEQEKGRLTTQVLEDKTKSEAQIRANSCLTREELIRCLQRRLDILEHGDLLELECQRLFSSEKEMQRQKRSVANRYGLDCGPPHASRITIHHTSSLLKHEVERRRTRLKGLRHIPHKLLSKPPVRGAACLASFIAVGTSTNYFKTSGRSESFLPQTTGYRRMLEEKRTGSTWKAVGVLCEESFRSPWVKAVGTWLGWASSGLYLGSRISQIALNGRRQSAEGLSLAMLTCAACANSCMGISILMRSESWNELEAKAPWLLGSLGTVSMDIFIVCQAKYFESRKRSSVRVQCDERQPLLV